MSTPASSRKCGSQAVETTLPATLGPTPSWQGLHPGVAPHRVRADDGRGPPCPWHLAVIAVLKMITSSK
eukprot:3047694-Karenia_brevis.AAC.1